jgi:hypothetical protein
MCLMQCLLDQGITHDGDGYCGLVIVSAISIDLLAD